MDLKHGFRLGTWEVRPLTGEVIAAAGTVHLEPKVIEVLLVLAEHSGAVVEREELLRRVWGSRAAVSDEPLTRCIAELRRAFGDSHHAPTFIQTIPKRGYRLLSPVAQVAVEPQRSAETPSSPQVKALRPVRIALAMGALLVATVAGLQFRGNDAQRGAADDTVIGTNTIAVLPFIEMGSADDAYLGDGVADEILNRLSSVDGLRVVARTSSFAFRGSTSDVRDIAERLRVAHLLEGSVQRSGDSVRVSAQLIDARRGYQMWAASYDGMLSDIFALQDEIANSIVLKLRETVATMPAGARIATPAPTDNLAAYELLLRGRQYLNRRGEDSLRRSVRLFREAIDLDPRYAQAYVELAKAYALLPSYSAELQDEMFDLALGTLAVGMQQAPAIDAQMQSVLALVSLARWDWIAAEIAFRRALEGQTNDSDLLVWYSQFLSAVGRPTASAEYARRAREVDLLSPVVNHRLSVASLWIDEDAEAQRYSEIADELGMGPTANPDSYIVLKLRFGDYRAVRPMLIGVQTMFARPTSWVDPLLEALASPDRRAAAVAAVASAELARDIPRKYLLGAWVYLDERDRALAAALELVNDRPSFNVEFIFSREARSLRSHPQFGELIRAIGLNRYWDQFGWPEMCEKQDEEIVCR